MLVDTSSSYECNGLTSVSQTNPLNSKPNGKLGVKHHLTDSDMTRCFNAKKVGSNCPLQIESEERCKQQQQWPDVTLLSTLDK